MDHAAPSSTVVDASTAQLATDILAGAFYRDPLWGWAFPDDARRFEQHRAVWGMFVDAAIRYPWVRLNESGTAVALWIPPGGSELTDEGEAAFEPRAAVSIPHGGPDIVTMWRPSRPTPESV